MLKIDVLFEAGDAMTPDFAAKLAQAASRYSCKVSLKTANIELGVDSLIGILAMDMRRGGKVTVIADGQDEYEAGVRICELLKGIA